MKKTLLLVLAASLVLASAAAAKDPVLTKKAGDYTVTVAFEKNPPVTGKNRISITLKDPAGLEVTDARVVLEYSMPPMPGMPAMNYRAEAKSSGGNYAATADFSMAGPWNLSVRIERAGKTSQAKFNVDVR